MHSETNKKVKLRLNISGDGTLAVSNEFFSASRTGTADECADTTKIPREERERIGMKCKRILDHARVQYLSENGFAASLKYYVKSDVTPENVCLIGVMVQQ